MKEDSQGRKRTSYCPDTFVKEIEFTCGVIVFIVSLRIEPLSSGSNGKVEVKVNVIKGQK